jgi:hypothetical protein
VVRNETYLLSLNLLSFKVEEGEISPVCGCDDIST